MHQALPQCTRNPNNNSNWASDANPGHRAVSRPAGASTGHQTANGVLLDFALPFGLQLVSLDWVTESESCLCF